MEAERQCRGQSTEHQMNGLIKEQCRWLGSQARYPQCVPETRVHAWSFPRDLISCTLFLKCSSRVHLSQVHTSGPSTRVHALVLPPESSCRATRVPCTLSLHSLRTPPSGNRLLSPTTEPEFCLSLNFLRFVSACFTEHCVSETHARCCSRQHWLLLLYSLHA